MLQPNRAPYPQRHNGQPLSAKQSARVSKILQPTQGGHHKVTNSGWGILLDPLFLDKFPGYGLFNWEKFRQASYREAQSAKTRLSLRDIRSTI